MKCFKCGKNITAGFATPGGKMCADCYKSIGFEFLPTLENIKESVEEHLLKVNKNNIFNDNEYVVD
jgi:protein-arginine kinase activator protein McsA